MPTWRTTLGRAVTPGKTPNIGQARELPIPFEEIHAIPWRESMAILPAGDPQPVDLRLSLPWILKDNFAAFGRPGPISILAPSEPSPQNGGDLSLALSLDQVTHGRAAPDAPNMWEWILPLIEPPTVWSAPAPQLGDNRLRPYQVEGVRQIVMGRSVLLADELGLGKTVQAAIGIYSLIQRGRARRALVVCSPGSLRHWASHLHAWAPGLQVCLVPPDSEADTPLWESPAHVFLTAHQRLVADIRSRALSEAGLSFDVVVLDDLSGARRAGAELWEALDQLHAPRRLALTGSPPGAEEYWLSVFNFLFPGADATEDEAGLMAQAPQPSPVTILRRTKTDVGAQIPPRTRVELWVDLQGEQRQSYQSAIGEERRRLAGLGDAVSPAHIQVAMDRLAHAASYGSIPGEGAKARLLVELLEDIAASGAKALVVVNDRDERAVGLAPTLEPFGVVSLDPVESGESLAPEIQRFRSDPALHVLIGGIDQVVDVEPIPALSYIFHVDPHWNPAVRGKVDGAFRPPSAAGPALTIYELWAAATYEAQLHAFMLDRARYTGGATDASAELSREDWLEHVIEIGKAASANGAPLQWTSDAETPSEVLPDKKLVTELDPSELTEGVTEFIHALGFPDIEQLFGNSETGLDLLAWRESEGRIERILVRCLTEEGNVGIADARTALDLLDEHPDISRVYLVGVGDFSAAAKKAAEDSDGRLELISGSELARHLRLLGKLALDQDDPVG